MKTLNSPFKFMVYCIGRAMRHPKTPLTYFYCSSCKLRFNSKEKKCPKCGDKVEASPDPRQESPIPWWGSIIVIILGITCWVLGAMLDLAGMDELGKALVYLPLGNLFGLSIKP